MTVAFTIFALSATSCTKDDTTGSDDGTVSENTDDSGASSDEGGTAAAIVDIAEAVSGTYSGTLSIEVEEQELASLDYDVIVEKSDDSLVNVSVADFSIEGLTFGDIVMTDCAVEETEEGVYSLSGEQTISFDNVGDCDVAMTGSVEDGTLVLSLDIYVTVLDTTVSVNFTGTQNSSDADSE